MDIEKFENLKVLLDRTAAGSTEGKDRKVLAKSAKKKAKDRQET